MGWNSVYWHRFHIDSSGGHSLMPTDVINGDVCYRIPKTGKCLCSTMDLSTLFPRAVLSNNRVQDWWTIVIFWNIYYIFAYAQFLPNNIDACITVCYVYKIISLRIELNRTREGGLCLRNGTGYKAVIMAIHIRRVLIDGNKGAYEIREDKYQPPMFKLRTFLYKLVD